MDFLCNFYQYECSFAFFSKTLRMREMINVNMYVTSPTVDTAKNVASNIYKCSHYLTKLARGVVHCSRKKYIIRCDTYSP